ncbi:CmpA/NrtA family ABC transporter substrate-binding protein [Xanthomonas hortorum pv. vitians]|jgi:nitrate/nitrite transport system substrate-binding protein|uniref:CmpA/NrtA family ABC transporter substrate-binding protein n=4 Tax=Xanthomonas hortorum TaxID=56454 RepID=A0A6V7E5U3_9XANT|nr:CmpA/NrtA family ABC transporter substrate-binding protein [Xanthomonas hortorum]MCC4624817.1 ABC transporter substrate-binding protein [Xanthomonas campestris pv. nigromaculans]APP80766.1 nitrate ABC transporter substrate-binding protein [Xanthomonas hortorum pv. gardneri]APP84876.1 nitrate ABC transporter substrate-binding protein [Xanthomonas hortorum pv. gardneri]ASW45169.1 nitrate ABC transporter substrate-binding protein [Xanthomonas hortorum]EGD20909.1 ABC-type nitrate/sulfonate/bica
MSQANLPVLRVAYMPLIDCAPLIAAQRLGLDRAHGLQLELQRQASWAGVRDRLLAGEVDAAHALASLVYAIDLGIAGPQCPMALLMTLNHNGQAITLAPALAQALADGHGLPQVLTGLGRRAVFAQTFPTGTHALWLYYWLAACGVDPMRDVDVLSIPPPQMPEALASGLVDGYCSGEPWAAVAEAQGSGRRVIRSGELWAGHPEKVLACRREFAALQPELTERLTACVLEACRWLDAAPGNRTQCAQWLAEPQHIGVSAAHLAACLDADIEMHANDATALAFHRNGAVNMPWLSDGEWFLTQFQRWGWHDIHDDDIARLRDIHRLDNYRRAAASVGVAVPDDDHRSNRLFDAL